MHPKTVHLLRSMIASLSTRNGPAIRLVRGNALTMHGDGSITVNFREERAPRNAMIVEATLIVNGKEVTKIPCDQTVRKGQRFGFTARLDAEGIQELETKFGVK